MKDKLTSLGARIGTDVKDCTHLVFWGTITFKLYAALCRVKYVVSPTWVQESIKAKRFVDETNHISNVPDIEKHHGLSIAEILKKPDRHLIFKVS